MQEQELLRDSLSLSSNGHPSNFNQAQLDEMLKGRCSGLIEQLPAASYHWLTEYVSFHTVDVLSRSSALECRYCLDHRKPPANVMVDGSAGHSFLIESTLAEFGIIPSGVDGRTKDGKETIRRLKEQFGPNLISEEWAEALLEIEGIYRSHHAVQTLILPNVTLKEASIFFQDSELELLRKSRPDIYCERTQILADLKFVDSFGPPKNKYYLERKIENWGYHRQLAYYCEALGSVGLGVEHCILIFIKRTKPYDVAVMRVTDDAIEAGHKQNRENLKVFAECLATDVWPGAYPSVTEIGLPNWSSVGHETKTEEGEA